jgi:thiamine biosynthesis lipoprotein
VIRAAADAGIAEVARIEAKYSRYRDDSVASAINQSAGSTDGVLVDDETAALLDYAQTAWEQSDGLFDITSGVLREVWDFRSGVVPSEAAVREVKSRIGWHRVDWDRPQVRLPAGMQIDFGGYGKEYAADRAAATCRQQGVDAGLVDLGGDVRVIGAHPDGSAWEVGVRDPRSSMDVLAHVSLGSGSIATSGDYQRFMTVDGVRYSHILDPRTGWPVEDGLTSVSVVASHCLVAGTASTIAMLKGQDGAAWLDELELPNLRVDSKGEVGGSLYGVADSASSSRISSPSFKSESRDPSSRSGGAVATAVSPGNTTT